MSGDISEAARNGEFRTILREHLARYPRMTPRDCVKLAYQSEFGPEHLIASGGDVLPALLTEWEQSRCAAPRPSEAIGNGLVRFPLTGAYDPASAAPLLAELFARTAGFVSGTREGLEARLSALSDLPLPGMEEFLAGYRAQGCPALGHSGEFRAAYAPHYRLLRTQYACVFPALTAVRALLDRKTPALVAIDGRCGSGKSSLASLLESLFPCRVFHMDDYYLPHDRRAPDWEQTPAGNMDLARFRREVLEPACRGETARTRAYDCRTGAFAPERAVPPGSLTVAEGSYSQHPTLADCYDLRIFLTCAPEKQTRRLRAREGEYFPVFQSRWIPLEERYFRACGVEKNADLTLDTGCDFHI